MDNLTTEDLKIGDELLITGHAEETEAGLVLRNSRADLLWHGSPVPPLSVTADEAAAGKFAALLIEVDGRLVSMERRNGETWLRLGSGHQEFLVHLNQAHGNSLFPRMQVGSVLRIRGVCSLLPKDTQYQGGFAILLRSAEDVSVVSGPPWWSLRHLFELGILLGVLIVSGHVILVQMLKARFRAIMAERAKMGHELHDTLAQGFAGLSYQIQAARRIVPKSNEVLSRHLDVALDMVRHSHSEAHRSIMMLRPQSLAEGADLHSAIQASLEQSTADCDFDVRFATSGPVTRLPLITTDALYRVAQEAIANALRHGRPTRLEVKLQYTPGSVCLFVRDNGIGFEPRALKSRGFGLLGMRERIRSVRGNFSVESEPGAGTCVTAEVYLRQSDGSLPSRLRVWQSHCRNRFQRMLENNGARRHGRRET
ncbi:MAG TPA: sensor histidine kinase [Candidatus Cybelea sp.]|nr:sensor histidine kinase [Candidatus Cybelea sp.]